MPSVTYEATLSGVGSDPLGGSRVAFVAWEVTIVGPTVRLPRFWDTDARLGIGHYSLGNDLTPGGLISGVGYGSPRWIESLMGQHVVTPALVGSDFSWDLAQYIRWAIEPGTEVHLYVFGDT